MARMRRTGGGSMLGDVNISAILDSFSVSYDKRVRPNYGGVNCDFNQMAARFSYRLKPNGWRSYAAFDLKSATEKRCLELLHRDAVTSFGM
ncbi:hypothetical protein J437_LFUL007378 [Ladona fulva]|uniref:Uncharacterized protein n=1 Tax=Ladona fulva TaxID=123851 RepID=A0A8K0K290_LADFU|nr:hypothetical protein J437_LFUL007378 [Ladona fulva]